VLLRTVRPSDLDFLARTNAAVDAEGLLLDPARNDLSAHREAMATFLSDVDRAAWVYEDTEGGRRVGMVACVFRSWPRDQALTHGIFDGLDANVFPSDGRFCEVFQLWVDPSFRRQGLATRMKQELEAESLRRGVHMIYTHTEASNVGVIELQRKLGYSEIAREPIWDSTLRVRFVKHI
jgi:ribosomal protein S18 acetylase RimI-like enzyme